MVTQIGKNQSNSMFPNLLASLNELNSKKLPCPFVSDKLGYPKVPRPYILHNLISLHDFLFFARLELEGPKKEKGF